MTIDSLVSITTNHFKHYNYIIIFIVKVCNHVEFNLAVNIIAASSLAHFTAARIVPLSLQKLALFCCFSLRVYSAVSVIRNKYVTSFEFINSITNTNQNKK